jgi:hypothetical protein
MNGGYLQSPIWENPTQRVTLVERVDAPGLLGVAVRGGRFVCALPQGYDGYTHVEMMENGQVAVLHPTRAPLLADPATGRVELFDGLHDGVKRLVDRMRLRS